MAEAIAVEGISKWDIEAWIMRLGSMPTKRLAHHDFSGEWEMNRAHVLALENGQFALVTESGCSCYSSSDAEIDLFPTEKAALESFDKWKKAQERA